MVHALPPSGLRTSCSALQQVECVRARLCILLESLQHVRLLRERDHRDGQTEDPGALPANLG
eukprot:6208303-Amphidinium_carterae.2